MADKQMPNDPGAPENTDEEFISPDRAESLADEAADAAASRGGDGGDATDPLGAPISDEALDVELEELLDDVDGGADPENPNRVNPDADGDGAVSDFELQLAERTDDLQRVSAEYANYRRRTERERAEIADQAKAKFVDKLLPLLDDLDLAKQHGDLEQGPLKAFSDKFHNVLEGQKVADFGAEGEVFDPEIHEAVQDLSSGDEKVIGTVLRKGYRLGDRLIRNAMVIIADPAGEQPATE